MSEPRKVWIGDEWRNCDDGSRNPHSRRAQQSKADADYALGKITLAQWRKEFERISLLAADGTQMEMPV